MLFFCETTTDSLHECSYVSLECSCCRCCVLIVCLLAHRVFFFFRVLVWFIVFRPSPPHFRPSPFTFFLCCVRCLFCLCSPAMITRERRSPHTTFVMIANWIGEANIFSLREPVPRDLHCTYDPLVVVACELALVSGLR